jgi:Protein of unknown function (DUF2914)/Tetratricopeptide repeat
MESGEARPILAAAEAAAAIDDYATAERLLRDAAAVQERTLGRANPDLANTFNNLGVICERAGKIDEAEASYRRAYSIATSAFPPDHPFVATSRQNLEEFCAANGRSAEERSAAARSDDESVERAPAPAAMRLQLDTPPPLDAGPQGPAYTAAPPTQPTHTAERVPIAQRVQERPSMALPLGALAALGISFTIVLVGLIAWPSRNSDDAPANTEATPSAPAVTEPTAPPTERPPATTPSEPAAVRPDRASSNVTRGGLTVVDARLCRTLSTRGQWECAPLGDPAAPGPMFFYTRIVSPQPTKVQHRWYFGDRLEQNVTLDIQPNSGGYRTFSRRMSNARHAGPWRVELRGEDGQLLREERFTVGPAADAAR